MRGFNRFASSSEGYKEKQDKKSDWLNDFANKVVQNPHLYSSATSSIYEKILDTLQGNNSKTVQAVVDEYVQATGLSVYLKTVAENKTKNASEEIEFLTKVSPELKNKIINFVNNRADSFKGYTPTLSIQEEVFSAFQSNGLDVTDVYESGFQNYVSNLLEAKRLEFPSKNDYSNLGKIDNVSSNSNQSDANSDYFFNLTKTV